MIRIFSSIRQKLLAEGKTARYLKYAAGEIVLVVAGILIALQVNNWNEQRKAKDFELKIIQQIAKAIESDIGYFQALDERLQSADQSSQNLIELIDKGDVDRKTFLTLLEESRAGYLFYYDRGAFDALKASGVENISNDDLRYWLIRYYDFYLPRTERLLDKSDNETLSKEDIDLQWQLYEFEPTLQYGKYVLQRGRYKADSIHQPGTYKYLYLMQGKVSHARLRIQNIKENAQQVLESLEKEIELLAAK